VNPYEILNVQPGASAESIKEAYHALAKQWHPDRFTGSDRELAEKKFRQLAEAFAILKNASPRATVPVADAALPAQAIELDHPDAEAFANGSAGSFAGGPPVVHGASEWYSQAKRAYETKRYEQALSFIQYAVSLDKEKYDYHQLQAKILDESEGDKRALVGALENCLRLNNRDADSAIRLAEIYQSLGMYSRATRYWEWARNLRPDHPFFEKQQTNAKEAAREAAEGITGQVKLFFDSAKGAFGKLTGKG
jgi:curved DNA-binding protein CbpA